MNSRGYRECSVCKVHRDNAKLIIMYGRDEFPYMEKQFSVCAQCLRLLIAGATEEVTTSLNTEVAHGKP